MKICETYNINFVVTILLSFATVLSLESKEKIFNVFRKQFPLGERIKILYHMKKKVIHLFFREAVWSVHRI